MHQGPFNHGESLLSLRLHSIVYTISRLTFPDSAFIMMMAIINQLHIISLSFVHIVGIPQIGVVWFDIG